MMVVLVSQAEELNTPAKLKIWAVHKVHFVLLRRCTHKHVGTDGAQLKVSGRPVKRAVLAAQVKHLVTVVGIAAGQIVIPGSQTKDCTEHKQKKRVSEGKTDPFLVRLCLSHPEVSCTQAHTPPLTTIDQT